MAHRKRKYRMGKRARTTARTRERILEATMEVHDEQGIVAGRWPDIAERAGVSLATIYRHFPTLEHLVTACGELTMDRIDPPTAERAAELFREPASRAERIERLVAETFGFYERAGRVVDNVRRDREKLPALQHAHDRLEAGLVALVDAALAPLGVSVEDRRRARALLDVRVWEALRDGGLPGASAVQTGVRMLTCLLGGVR